MKAYVGAPLIHWPAARKAMSALRSMGHEITHDWTLGAEAFYQGDHNEKARDIALKCIEGVKAADLAFFLPRVDVTMQGTWVELGAALALERPVIVYLPDLCDKPVSEWLKEKGAFFHHPLVTGSSDYNQCFRHIRQLGNW